MKLYGWIALAICSTALFTACKKDPVAGKGRQCGIEDNTTPSWQ